jgi:hypothetical protein
VTELGRLVAESADAADLHAAVPALLLELQTELGALAATATTATERGRRPFRPPPDWNRRLGLLGYGIYLLADQSGVELDAEIRSVAKATSSSAVAQQRRAPDDNADWFGPRP